MFPKWDVVRAWLLPLVNYRGSVSRFGGLRASPEQLCAPQPLCTHNMGQPGQFWGPHPPSPPQGAAFGQLPARLHHARGPAASRCHTAPPGMLSTRCPVPVPAPRACAVAFLANPLASRRPFWKPPPPIVPAATSQGDAMLLSLSTLSAHHHFCGLFLPKPLRGRAWSHLPWCSHCSQHRAGLDGGMGAKPSWTLTAPARP